MSNRRAGGVTIVLVGAFLGYPQAFASPPGQSPPQIRYGIDHGVACEPESSVEQVFEARDGEPLEFWVEASDVDAGSTVTMEVSALPSGSSMTPQLPINGNPVRSAFQWTPTYDQAGMYSMTFAATDGDGTKVTCDISVRVLIATSLEAGAIVAELRADPRVTFGKFRAILKEQTTQSRLAHKEILFRGPGEVAYCSSLTDDRGIAECGNVEQSTFAVIYFGRYFAVFEGDTEHAASASWGPTARVESIEIP